MQVEKNHSRVPKNELITLRQNKSSNNKIVFSTFQSAKNNLETENFNMIIVDEAHHLKAPQYK
jgi:superfamily II DNA or RNA helicase